MGEKAQEELKLQFDRQLRLEFHAARITSDAGLLACRELDGVLGMTEAALAHLGDTRGGRNVQNQVVPLPRQSTAIWRATRMPTTRRGWPGIQRCR